MSETEEQRSSGDASSSAPEEPQGDKTEDWFLQSIVALANAGIEIGLTLVVGGLTVSGIVIGGKRYFEELGASVKGANAAPEVQDSLATSWAELAGIYEKPEGAPDDWNLPPATFIHLRSAHIFEPGGSHLPSGQGVLWRGKIASVDGYTVGNLSVL